MPRGGRRAGTPGKVYQNRSDMSTGAAGPAGQSLPVTAATGQPYGAAGAQRAAQQALPMSTPPVAGASPTPPVGPSPGGGVGGPPSLALPPGAIEPGELPQLHAPTDRPDEHLMTGVNAGPGAGAEALNLPSQVPAQGVDSMSTAAFLGHLASQPGAPAEMVALAQMAQRRG